MALALDVRTWNLPFRIGATSYIIADDLLPNAAFLAAHVQDMQLVLFEVPDGPTNLPAPEDVAALAALGHARDLCYTVHLLHDLRLHDAGSDDCGAPALALAKAQQVIDLTRPLGPQAWVCHLDGRAIHPLAPIPPVGHVTDVTARWHDTTTAALQQVCTWAGDGRRVAVENLEGYAPEFVAPVVAATDAGRCVDVGHLWLDGVDPLPHLASALGRLRVVHLHGLAGGRDHASLAHMPPEQVDAVLRFLLAARFDGVLTLEIFGEDDFWSSLAALAAAVARCGGASLGAKRPCLA